MGRQLRDHRKNPEDWARTTKRDRIHDVKQMHEIHHQIKRRIFMGQKNTHIAKALGVGINMVSHVRSSIPIRKEINIMNDAADNRAIDLRNEIEKIAPAAVENLREVVEEGTLNGEKVGIKMITDESNKMIDRHIGKPAQTTLTKSFHAHFSAADIEKLKQEAIDRGLVEGHIVDAEVTEAETAQIASHAQK